MSYSIEAVEKTKSDASSRLEKVNKAQDIEELLLVKEEFEAALTAEIKRITCGIRRVDTLKEEAELILATAESILLKAIMISTGASEVMMLTTAPL